MVLLLACVSASDSSVKMPPMEETQQDTEDSPSDSSTETEDSGTTPSTVKPCFTYEVPVQTGVIADPGLEELSDIVPSRKTPGLLWVHEDSGNPSVITGINASGVTVGTFHIEGAEMVDWEDMAMGECDGDWCLWIGDIGDNQVNRATVRLLEVVEPAVDLSDPTPFDLTLPARAVYDVPYPDADHNAEALIWSPAGPAILTKVDTTTTLYQVDLASKTMALKGTLTTSGVLTTAADLWSDGSRMLVRTYTSLDEFWLPQNGLNDLGHSIRVPVPVAAEKQGESASYDPERRGYWTVSEGVNQPIFWSGCSAEAPGH